MKEIANLEQKISAAKTNYYNGSATTSDDEYISDDEYDLLVEDLSLLDPHHKLITNVGAEPSSEWTKEKHLYPLGSLNKLNSLPDFKDWYKQYSANIDVCLVEKLDGLSIGAEYNNGKLVKAILRGNAIEGENILNNFVKMLGVQQSVSDNFTGILRGEILLTNNLHQKHFKEYANPRNSASGICRKLDGIGCQYLSVYFYQVIGNIDFKSEMEQFSFLKKNNLLVPNYYICSSPDEVWKLYNQYCDKKRNELNYWIDGLVVSCNDLAHQKEMGEIHHRPRAKIAIKFPNQFAKTTIKEVDWQVGNSGRLTPVAWFEPIDLLGSIVEKASLYNPAYIKQINVGINSTVLVCKANEIIPRVEKTLTPGKPITLPTKCPVCDGQVEMVGENLQCLETDTCPAQVCGKIKNWVKTLDILEWGDKLIEKLVDEGLANNIADLYALSIDDLANLERMGQTSATKCHSLLWKHNPINLELFVGGLSIPMVGTSTIQLLIDNGLDTLEKIRSASCETFAAIKGFGPVRSQCLFDGLKHNATIIDGLLKAGITVREKNETNNEPAVSAKLAGMTMCITGATQVKRSDLIKIITDNGGTFVSSVSKKCTHLIMSQENFASSKAQTLMR